MIEQEYTVSFTFAGRKSTYHLDVRRLACIGVPKKFAPELLSQPRLKHMPSVLKYINTRNKSAKQNAFSNIKAYFLWSEESNCDPFELRSLIDYEQQGISDGRRKEITRFLRSIGIEKSKKKSKNKTKKRKTVTPRLPKDDIRIVSAPEQRKVNDGILSATDGSHVIVIHTRSKGVCRRNISKNIAHLNDHERLFNSLRELLDNVSGDTFIAHLNTYCTYAQSAQDSFFDIENLWAFLRSQQHIVKKKLSGANLAQRRVNQLIRIFDTAEADVPDEIRFQASKLPTPRSTPVQGYDQTRYRKLIKLLFNRFTSAKGYLEKNDKQDIFDNEVEAMNELMNCAYYLISRYSAWTDSTIKNITKEDVAFDNSEGEWIHLRGIKSRGGYKVLDIDLPGEHQRIKKTGYEIITTLVKFHEKYQINLPYLLFRVSATGTPIFFTRDNSFNNDILNDIPGLNSLSTQRIRETEISQAHTSKGIDGAIKRSGSSSDVVKRHYSEGSAVEHNSQLGSVANTLSDIASAHGKTDSIKDIKKRLYGKYQIPIVEIEGVESNTPIGTRCTTPSTQKSFPKKAEKLGFGKLSCADLIACFECKSVALIDSVDDIWNILSFKERIVQGKLFSVDREHHAKNFNEVIARIELIITQFNPENTKAAQEKLITEGAHPFWNEDDLF